MSSDQATPARDVRPGTPSVRELQDLVAAVQETNPELSRDIVGIMGGNAPTGLSDFLDPGWPNSQPRPADRPTARMTTGNTSEERPHTVEIDVNSLRPNREWASRNMPRIHPIQPDSLSFVELTLVTRLQYGFRRDVLTGSDMNHLRCIREQTERRRPHDWVNNYVSILACPDAEQDAWTWDVIPIELTCMYCTQVWTLPSSLLKDFQREARQTPTLLGTDAHQLITECDRCRRRVYTYLRFEYLRNALFRRNQEEGWVLPSNAVARTLTGR